MYDVYYDRDHAKSLSPDSRLAFLRQHIISVTDQWPAGNTLNIDRWRDFTPAEHLDILINGYDIPFHSEPHGMTKNHKSLRSVAEVASAEWTRLERLGKVEYFDEKPPQLHATPVAGIVKTRPGIDSSDTSIPYLERYKLRLITDLLRSGVNLASDAAPKCSFGNLDSGARLMTICGYLFVIDLSDAFFHWPISHSSAFYLGFYDEHRKQWGRYLFCPFGLQQSPYLNDLFVKLALGELKRCHDIDLCDFVDDNMGGGPDFDSAWDRFETAVLFFLSLGIRVSYKPSGLVPPAQVISWIGWQFNTVPIAIADNSSRQVMSVTVTDEKRTEGIKRIETAFQSDSNNTLTVRGFLECLGYLQHLAEICLPGKRRLHSCWFVVNSSEVHSYWQKGNKRHDPKISLTSDASRDLLWWKQMLSSPHEIWRPVLASSHISATTWTKRSPDFVEIEQTVASCLDTDECVWVFETDASLRHGWGFVNSQTQESFRGDWPADISAEDRANINYLEFWVVCKKIMPHILSKPGHVGRRILVRCDNKGSVCYTNFRYGDYENMEALAAHIDHAEMEGHFLVLSTHIKGVRNTLADALSREQDSADKWNRDKFRDVCLLPKIFNCIEDRLGDSQTFACDAFCDQAGHNSRIPGSPFYSLRNSALIQKPADLPRQCWAFPPRQLCTAWLTKVTEEDIPSVTLVIADPNYISRKFMRSYMQKFKRIHSFPAGSKIFGQIIPNTYPPKFKKGPAAEHEVWALQYPK